MPPVLRQHILARLQENGVPLAELPLQNGVTILLSQHGGRIYGPFLTPQSASLYWVPPQFNDAAAFATYLKTSWNLGGERIWVAPEIQYLVPDRTDYFGTIFIPPAMDPGNWKLEALAGGRWRLSQEITLKAFTLAHGRKTLYLESVIQPAPNPLRHLRAGAALMEGVTYAGYEQSLTIIDRQPDDILSGMWNLVMLNPGGELLIPCSPEAEVTCYKGDLNERILHLEARLARLKITADQMYKAGLKAAQTYGRMAYLHEAPDGAYLLARSFSNHPCAELPEEPPDQPGRRGDSIHVYNDSGEYGDLGEMECSGRTIGGLTGFSEAHDSLALCLFAGPPAQLKAIARQWLGTAV
jgi:hypothetical protein